MDSARFDRLSRMFALRMTRRRAVAALGANVAFGTARAPAVGAAAAQFGGDCQLELVATVRLGQSAGALFGGTVPGELAGTLQFSGDIFDGATFLRTDNEVLTATGDVSGSAATIRLTDPSGNVLVLV